MKHKPAKAISRSTDRVACNCQASKHDLCNNCIVCGRIICIREGPGPCLFCGTDVRIHSDDEPLENEAKLMTAINAKNKLLEFDRTSAKRTTVIDDESDYYVTGQGTDWTPAAQRAANAARPDLTKRDKTIKIDFAGREVTSGLQSISSMIADNSSSGGAFSHNEALFQPYASTSKGDGFRTDDELPAEYVPTVADELASRRPMELPSGRLQDESLDLMTDNGKCLSLHQPWASLLVAGIMVHEGRSWYTNHRGRLWIASTVREPSPQDVADVEGVYRALGHARFPSQYPTACLLGCVDVVDCLPQEQYRELFPNGVSASPYVFICENAKELKFRFPNKGEHKIYNLDPTLHQAAKKQIYMV